MNLAVDYQYNTLDLHFKPKRNTVLTALATAFDYNQIKVHASILGTFIFENVKKEYVEKPADKKEYTPAIFLSYKPFKLYNLNFRTFYKRIFRMPTFNDLYYTDITGESAAGNTKLKPEYATQYNIGFQYTVNPKKGIINHLNISSDGYFNQVEDKIIAVPKGNSQYRWMMQNLGYVEIRGIDIATQIGWKLPAGIQLNTSLNYTFQKAQDFSKPESDYYGGQIAYIPWHSGSAIANILWKTWDLNYSFIYVGERYHNSANIPANHEQPWYTHDLTLGKSFAFNQNTKFKISAEINNLLNQQYEVIQNYPMPGRNYKIILKLEI